MSGAHCGGGHTVVHRCSFSECLMKANPISAVNPSGSNHAVTVLAAAGEDAGNRRGDGQQARGR